MFCRNASVKKHQTAASLWLLVGIFLASSGCSLFKKKSSPTAEQPAPQGPAAECGGQDCASLAFVQTITRQETFDAFAAGESQLGAFSKSVKFFVDGRKPGEPAVYFINANYTYLGETPESAKMHYDFALAYLQIPEGGADYNQVTYFTNDKIYYAGSIQKYFLAENDETVYGVQFFPQDIISETTILKALQLVSSKFNIPASKMAFVSTGQQQSTTGVASAIEALGYRVMTIDEVLGSLKYLQLNAGEAWGYLRLFPESQDELRATDIVVFDKLPLDLTVVAGVITKAYQDPNSHINLKSRERQTPNMMLRDASDQHPALSDYIGKPVRLRVHAEGFEVTPSTVEEIETRYRERMSRPWISLQKEDEPNTLSYDDMCPIDPSQCTALKRKFGAKAANLGFLAQPNVLGRADQPGTMSQQLGYDLSPRGFGVPFSFYDAFITAPENAAVKAKIDELVAAEKSGTLSPGERRALAATVRQAILDGLVPAMVVERIGLSLASVLPGVKRIKIRSSANAEDISGFNGAGLYDSYMAKPLAEDIPAQTNSACVIVNKMNKHGAVRQRVMPATVACAVKAVYASLWNVRAIDERTFSRIDHGSVAMGLAIVPAYDIGSKIAANSVLVTRVPNTRSLSGYSMSTYQGNNLVTNPAAGTWSELGVAVLLTEDVPTSITTTRFAKSFVDQPVSKISVLSLDQNLTLVKIAKSVEIAWCLTNPAYYPPAHDGRATCEYTVWDDDKPKALDFEFKLREDGRVVAKQVREFSGRK